MNKNQKPLQKGDVQKLLLAGISFGLTSVLYYIAIRFINASMGVVLLMQSVWMGVFIEALQEKKIPNLKKITAVGIVLLGTILATNLMNQTETKMDYRGIIFGLMAAFSFSIVLFSTQKVALHLSAEKRSLYMLYGGSIVVVLLTMLSQILPYYLNVNLIPNEFISNKPLDLSLLISWGIPIALFGTVIPPLMFNKGFPIVGVGLGSILSAFELPVSIVISFLILGEIINDTQWFGVALILSAILLLNINLPSIQQLKEKRIKN
ncbi:MAG: EamA family transporter [Bacteroidetes bacterium]|nr:EamA family transporter [Bacteroidota bacterium]